jgi:hypothetical protein
MCYLELSMLPAPLTTDPSTEFLLRITKFCADFHAAIFGEARKALVQHNRHQYDRFKNDIHKTCPDFRPFEDHTKYYNPGPFEVGPIERAGPPLDLHDVQKVIDGSVASSISVLENPIRTSFFAVPSGGNYPIMFHSTQPGNLSLRLPRNGKILPMRVLRGFSTTLHNSLTNWSSIILAGSNFSMPISGQVYLSLSATFPLTLMLHFC